MMPLTPFSIGIVAKSGELGYDMDMEDWYEKRRRELLSCSIFRITEAERESEGGKRGSFYILEAPNWVTVVPLTRDDKKRRCFVMVEQYRHGSGRGTIEFPAGTVDPGELPEEAARRELREETGYEADTMQEIGVLSPNPAFMSNFTHTFFSEGLKLVGGQQLDTHESIRVHSVPIDEVREKMGTGRYDNAIMLAALALYDRYERKKGRE